MKELFVKVNNPRGAPYLVLEQYTHNKIQRSTSVVTMVTSGIFHCYNGFSDGYLNTGVYLDSSKCISTCVEIFSIRSP